MRWRWFTIRNYRLLWLINLDYWDWIPLNPSMPICSAFIGFVSTFTQPKIILSSEIDGINWDKKSERNKKGRQIETNKEKLSLRYTDEGGLKKHLLRCVFIYLFIYYLFYKYLLFLWENWTPRSLESWMMKEETKTSCSECNGIDFLQFRAFTRVGS